MLDDSPLIVVGCLVQPVPLVGGCVVVAKPSGVGVSGECSLSRLYSDEVLRAITTGHCCDRGRLSLRKNEMHSRCAAIQANEVVGEMEIADSYEAGLRLGMPERDSSRKAWKAGGALGKLRSAVRQRSQRAVPATETARYQCTNWHPSVITYTSLLRKVLPT